MGKKYFSHTIYAIAEWEHKNLTLQNNEIHFCCFSYKKDRVTQQQDLFKIIPKK